ncbi:hypothetical protein K469DRAFT_279748 [Zopfia rhizophila CBS 207.26]|uniref:Uncharacterized protein n=1 Tax=Zopfia rhizophila CBS 207.26 TaxID=1314779 RepID=A0A6A6EMQ9_9PEZI|nr:hypothetical protein K469DRAFT_279748 [Zopfia rhizophila CBS 207.26]
MPITEFVLPFFKPEIAKEGLATLRVASKAFDGSTGLLYRQIGHVLRLNGVDISSNYRPVVGLEWDKPESFHTFFPASPFFAEFRGKMGPFLTNAPTPQLFRPSTGKERSEHCFESGLTQFFIGDVEGGKEEVDGAWERLVKELEREGRFVGILGWEGLEEYEAVGGSKGVRKAQEGLMKKGFEDFVVKFGE